jgi:hypothetical protein
LIQKGVVIFFFKTHIFFDYEFCLIKLLHIIVVAKVATEGFVQQRFGVMAGVMLRMTVLW